MKVNTRAFLASLAAAVVIGEGVAAAVSVDSSSDHGVKQGSGNALLQRFDLNQDGVITLDEFPESAQRFHELDKNGDGALDVDELPHSAVEPKKFSYGGQKNEGGSGLGSHGAPGGAPPGGGGGQPPPFGDFDTLDKDHDGKLTKDEFQGPEELFKKLDKNSDGVLSREEFQPPPQH